MTGVQTCALPISHLVEGTTGMNHSVARDVVVIADVGEAKDFTQMQDDTSRERRTVFTGKTYRLTLTRRMILLE